MSATTAGDVTAAWAIDATTALAEGAEPWTVPEYGSAAWHQLRPDAPERAAALIEAAELHRRAVAEEQRLHHLADTDPTAWHRKVTEGAYTAARRAAARIADQPTHAELAARRAKHVPARDVRASDGWPPIRIPGRPGWRRHYVDGQQVDLPDNAQEQAA